MRRLRVFFCSALLLLANCPVHAQEAAQERFTVRKAGVSRVQAIGLSVLFPGLGQLANGRRYKGTGLVVGEVACLVVWLTSHADYNTYKEQFGIEQERYLALQNGGSFDEAQESWERLEDQRDDLDRSHARRWLFGSLTVGLYGYNLLDVLVLGGGDPVAGKGPGPGEKRFSLAPLSGFGAPGVALVARF